MNPPADQSPRGGDPQGLHAKHASGGDAQRQAQNTGTVDLEKRLEALLARPGVSGYLYSPRLIREALTQLREYRTSLEARPAMPEREALKRIRALQTETLWDVPDRHSGDRPSFKTLDAAEVFGIIDAVLPTTGDVREAAPEREASVAEEWCAYMDEAVAKAPEPLRKLGEHLASVLDEDQWKTAERYLNAAALRGEGWAADCPKCVGSKFVCDEHYTPLASPPSAHDMREALERIMDRAAVDGYPEKYEDADIIRAALSSPMDAVNHLGPCDQRGFSGECMLCQGAIAEVPRCSTCGEHVCICDAEKAGLSADPSVDHPLERRPAVQGYYLSEVAAFVKAAVEAEREGLGDAMAERDGIAAEMRARFEASKPHKARAVADITADNLMLDLLAVAERGLSKSADRRTEKMRAALQKIADAPAWGYPERWETTPAEVRQLAREALQ